MDGNGNIGTVDAIIVDMEQLIIEKLRESEKGQKYRMANGIE